MPPVSECEKCGGSGWIIRERANLSGAEPCGCRFSGRSARIEELAQIPPLYEKSSFENFDAPNGKKELRQAFNYVNKYVLDFLPDANRPGLLLIGEPGTGKTHLAVAAIRRLIQKGFECRFFDYQNLLDRIRAGYDANSNSSDKEAYREALDSKVLLLDDLGAHRTSDWVLDTVTSIVTYRCNHRKPLIATTNLPDGAAGCAVVEKSADGTPGYRETLADRIGQRARSRLFEMCHVYRMPNTEDYRLPKRGSF